MIHQITIELGRAVLEKFTRELGLFENLYKKKELGDRLVPFIDELQEELKEEAQIFLPPVAYAYDPDLPNTSICVSFSIHQEIYDKVTLKSLLCAIAERYSKFYTLEQQAFVLLCNPIDFVNDGNEALQAGHYNDAMNCYDKAVYLFRAFECREFQEPLINALYM